VQDYTNLMQKPVMNQGSNRKTQQVGTQDVSSSDITHFKLYQNVPPSQRGTLSYPAMLPKQTQPCSGSGDAQGKHTRQPANLNRKLYEKYGETYLQMQSHLKQIQNKE
jgi:hypothetical protein